MRRTLKAVLIRISMVAKDVEHLKKCSATVFTSSVENTVQYYRLSFCWSICCYDVWIWSCFYILYTNSLSEIQLTKIFLCSVDGLITQLTLSFAIQTPFNSTMHHFIHCWSYFLSKQNSIPKVLTSSYVLWCTFSFGFQNQDLKIHMETKKIPNGKSSPE